MEFILRFRDKEVCVLNFSSVLILCANVEKLNKELSIFMPEIHKVLSSTRVSPSQSFLPETNRPRNFPNPFALLNLCISHQKEMYPPMCQSLHLKTMLSLYIIKTLSNEK